MQALFLDLRFADLHTVVLNPLFASLRCNKFLRKFKFSGKTSKFQNEVVHRVPQTLYPFTSCTL